MAVRVQVDAAHPRLGGEGNKGCLQLVHLAGAQSEPFFCQDDNAAALGRFIGERS